MMQTRNFSLPCRFDFERDTFAFENELACEYVFDAACGRPKMVTRQPRPNFALRCFLVVRAARQFFFHAEFPPEGPPLGEAQTRERIRKSFHGILVCHASRDGGWSCPVTTG
jgi:hypothetical protein